MKINIPRIVRSVRLSDYAPEYGEQEVWMWVNPPKALTLQFQALTDEDNDLLARITELTKPLLGDGGEDVGEEAQAEIADALAPLFERRQVLAGEVFAWWAEMWSQHHDAETHWTAGEVQELAEAAMEHDPGFWRFLLEQTSATVKDYREQKKRN